MTTLLAFNWNLDLGVVIGIISLIIAGVSLTIGIRTHCQQSKLNKYDLEERIREREALKHANLVLEFSKRIKGGPMLILIKNTGKCAAKEIKIGFTNEIIQQYPNALEILSELPEIVEAESDNEVEFLCSSADSFAKYWISWVDDAGKQVHDGSFYINRNSD
ncbi:MAG: hypothetical protein K6A41_04475 [Bacteroidales bacterium]|nr:hypothetical protein [Bacteroidales bacterium]